MSVKTKPPVKIIRPTKEEVSASVKATIKDSKPGLVYLADR